MEITLVLSQHFHSYSGESKPLCNLAFRCEWLGSDFQSKFHLTFSKIPLYSTGLGHPQRRDYLFQTSCFMNKEIASETLS